MVDVKEVDGFWGLVLLAINELIPNEGDYGNGCNLLKRILFHDDKKKKLLR